MKHIHLYIAVILAGMLFLCSACSEEETMANGMDSGKIMVRLSLGDAPAVRAGVTDEDKIENLHLFVFPVESGFATLPSEAKCAFYQKATNVTADSPITLSASKTEFTKGSQYKVYLIANYQLPDGLTEKLQTLAEITFNDLTTLTKETPDFSSPDVQSFLMVGETESAEFNDGDLEQSVELEAELERAVAKIKLSITLDSDFLNNYDMGGSAEGATVTFQNFAKITNVFSLAEYAGNDKLATQKYNLSGQNNVLSFVLYSYANEWQEGVLDKRSSLIINIPVLSKKEAAQLYPLNLYAVSLDKFVYTEGEQTTNALKRNYEYTISATVKALGSNNPVDPLELKDATFSAIAWQEENVYIDGGETGHFLTVNYHELNLTSAAENHELHFASSDAIEVSVVTRDEDAEGGVWYYNKWGERKYIESSETASFNYPTFIPDDTREGYINIRSVCKNKAPKYFKIKIVNTGQDNLVEYVDVVQYPLEYITSAFGFYSYLTDEHEEATCDYWEGPEAGILTRVDRNGSLDSGSGSTNWRQPDIFYSKFITKQSVRVENYDGKVVPTLPDANLSKYYNTSGRGNWSSAIIRGDFYKNPRIYHVRITETSGEYTLGIPPLDSDGYTNDNDEVAELVSPSFMIASQLGALSTGGVSKRRAYEHCKRYAEVAFVDYEKGTVVKYTDWRLPTKAELAIIAEYQNDEEVMDKVLAYETYWCANGVYNVNNKEMVDENSAPIRCIRDANKPGEEVELGNTWNMSDYNVSRW